MRVLLFASPLVVAAVSGCGFTGSLDVTTFGEDFIPTEIPSEVFTQEPDSDVKYSKFLITFSNLTVGAEGSDEENVFEGPVVFNMHEAGRHDVTSFPEIEARRWDKVSAEVKPAEGTPAKGTDAVTDEDLQILADGGFSVYVEGTVNRSGDEKDFAWGFTTSTLFHDCQTADGGAGVVVPSGASGTWELTIHGDHLFYDDLQNASAKTRLSAIVDADGDDDGLVTMAELEAVDLTELPGDQYGTGGEAGVENLGDFVSALSRTLVHATGEGECTSQNID